MKVLVADPVGDEGIEILRGVADVDIKTGLEPKELISVIGEYDALVVRSQTQVTADVIKAGTNLQIIARAGVGVDNIDIDQATRQGIVVVNTPTGNTTAAAEHSIALMFALARHIPQANTKLKSGEWQRTNFMGVELRNKVLGIIGLGNVGTEVARRARGLEMKLIAYDPFVSEDYARNLQVELTNLKRLLKDADFITIHVPLTSSTKQIIGPKELAQVKPSARIINTARGGLIDDKALVKAVNEGKLAGAAIDVFEEEPVTSSILFDVDNIIVTPHLGASTAEAQAMVAEDVAEQIVSIFQGHPARYAVNAPFISVENVTELAPFIKSALTAGRLVAQLVEVQLNSIRIKYEGEISNYDTNILKAAVLRGLLEGVSEERINLVNANVVAARRGLSVVEQQDARCDNYASLITVEVTTGKKKVVVATTVIQGECHIVRVYDYWIDIYPAEGYFLFSDHLDRPGLLGEVGMVTGDANIDISSMHVGRLKPRGEALMILALDEPMDPEQQQRLLSITDIYTARAVKL